MREIKFRAINSEDEFIYGLPYTDSVNETAYYKEYSNRLCWRNEVGASCNQPYKNGTLEQYTGLKDKNGKESFWNDKVKTREGVGLIKEWNGNTWIEGIDWEGLILLSDRNVEFEIIGNSHEAGI